MGLLDTLKGMLREFKEGFVESVQDTFSIFSDSTPSTTPEIEEKQDSLPPVQDEEYVGTTYEERRKLREEYYNAYVNDLLDAYADSWLDKVDVEEVPDCPSDAINLSEMRERIERYFPVRGFGECPVYRDRDFNTYLDSDHKFFHDVYYDSSIYLDLKTARRVRQKLDRWDREAEELYKEYEETHSWF